MNYGTIIWDWNGTLLNDVGAAMASVNDMLISRGKRTIDIVRYKECISVPIIGFYEKVFDLEKEDYNEILKQYNEGYLRHLSECGLSDGVREALEFFKAHNCIQIIVSSSNNTQLMENVEKYGISGYFDAILGAENYLAESKIGRAEKFLREHGKGKVLVIGDLEHDAEMAEALGADCILLTTGHEKPERLAESGARVLNTLRKLPFLFK